MKRNYNIILCFVILLTMSKAKAKSKTKSPEHLNEWSDWYKTIGYQGNPMDKQFQQKVHDFYNSLKPEHQTQWLSKTDGLGWQDEYIQAIKEFWPFKGDKPIIRDEEDVNEYLTTLTDIERSNYKDICDVFSKDKPWLHIKDTNGFMQFKAYRETIPQFLKQYEMHKNSDISTILRSDEFAIYTFMETIPKIKNYTYDIKSSINTFLHENPEYLKEKLIETLKTSDFIVHCFVDLHPEFGNMDEDDIQKLDEYKKFLKKS